jgi:DNA-binding response OmpR family regulator
MKILIVEDNQATSSALYEILTQQHYSVNLATDGLHALELASRLEYDLILLDIIIPKVDGINVCKRLRNSGYQNPILLLTARDDSNDKVIGLDAGADDYVIKPFDFSELLARIRALLRRGKSVVTNIISWENLQLDAGNSEVTCNGQRLRLTPKEYCLLELFLLNPQRIYNRATILDKLWDFADSPGEETVSTHIKCVRQKLKAAGASDPIETVHGLGYRLRQPSVEKKLHTVSQNLKAKTLQIWKKYKNAILEQINTLEETGNALISNSITPDLLQRAKQESHKLAGSLGLFGLKQASLLARELENLFQSIINSKKIEVQEINAKIKLLRLDVDSYNQTLKTVNQSQYISPLILIVDDDLLLAQQLCAEAINWEMQVEVATDLNTARTKISQNLPDVILLDLNFPNQEDGLDLLSEITTQFPSVSVIAFTGSQSLTDRAAVARNGGCAFLHKPTAIHQIFSAIIETLNKKQFSRIHLQAARVLLVDDNTLVLNKLVAYLSDLGLKVETLNNSKQFWEVLTSFKPNLLILDLNMPDFNGIELCQVVRTDPCWQYLPIVFLSASTKQAEIDACFAAGANEYINKSTNLNEIANRIFQHLQNGTLQKVINRI